MADDEPLDVDAAVAGLRRALSLLLRSACAHTIAAGSLTGYQYVGLSELVWRGAEADLADARRLVEKIVALGGEVDDSVPEVAVPRDPPALVECLIEVGTEAVESLQDVISTTGKTGASEALEHRLEHVIMRKQELVDALRRAQAAS